MTERDHEPLGVPPEGCTLEELTAAVIRLVDGRSGTSARLSRNTLHEIRVRKRKLTENSFTKIVNAYADPGARPAWFARWHEVNACSVPAPAPVPAVPRQLPPLVANFVGREVELAELDRLAAERQEGEGPVILAITGGPGAGKTALAVCWAHRVHNDFPDGQLYVDLQGYAPDEPAPPERVLAGFLDALGVSRSAEADVADLTAQFRTAVAGRRMLVVLDNATDAEHVRPLLPGAPSSRIVVTSRNNLAGLAAGQGARRLWLTELTHEESRTLLYALIGRRAREDHDTTTKLAELCARLPLPRRIAAVRVDNSPTRRFPDLVAELEQEESTLDTLEAGDDERTAIRSVLSWSYEHLAAAEKHALHMFGLFPGTALDTAAAAALCGAGQRDAKRALAGLVTANLLIEDENGCHTTHDFVRAWAAELAEVAESPLNRRRALTRLFDHYLVQVTPADTDAARTWTRAQYDNLIAATTHMAEHGWHAQLIAMAGALTEYLAIAGYPRQAITLHENAAAAATAMGNDAALAAANLALGTIHWRTGGYVAAERNFATARRLYRALGDPAGEGRALTGLGSTYAYEGHHEQALTALTAAEELLRDAGDPIALGMALGTAASVHHALGDIPTSIAHLRRAAQIFHDNNDTVREGRALGNLGVDHHTLGDHAEARACHTAALRIHDTHGDRAAAGRAHLGLAGLDDHDGDHDAALRHLLTARQLFTDVEDRDGMVSVLSMLGNHYRHRDNLAAALHFGRQACTLADELGERESQAEAHNTLGETLLADGDRARAHAEHQLALDISTASGNPREQARARAGIARTQQ
jgi:tetratricopeptide (TPR) repeat protein